MPSSRGSPRPGMERGSLTSPALAGGFFITNTPWEAPVTGLVSPELGMQVLTSWSLVSLPMGLNFLPLIITRDQRFEMEQAASLQLSHQPLSTESCFSFLMKVADGMGGVGRGQAALLWCVLSWDGCVFSEPSRSGKLPLPHGSFPGSMGAAGYPPQQQLQNPRQKQ